MNTVKADVLNIKKTQIALETEKSSQVQAPKSTVTGLEILILLSSTVSKAATDICVPAEQREYGKKKEKRLG